MHTIPLTAQRGTIFDRNGRDLAMSIETTTVYADPTLVTDPIAEAARLAPRAARRGAARSCADLSDKGTAASPRHFVYLAHTVTDTRRQGGAGH